MIDPNNEIKAKRGWYFSIFFLFLIVCLVVFLSYVEIVKENRDVLVGILGVLTGSISSMMAIASGRDPSEVEKLQDKLSSANADREALIARLRDAQIQLQILRDQQANLQMNIIDKLSMFSGQIKKESVSDVVLHESVEEWIAKK
jgi:hypothetical protein